MFLFSYHAVTAFVFSDTLFSWKLIIDVAFISSVIGDFLFLAFIKNDELLMCMNLIFILVVTAAYFFYLFLVRKRDIESWLHQRSFYENHCVIALGRVNDFMTDKVPYWAQILLKASMTLPFTIIMLLTAFNFHNYAVRVISIIIAYLACFYMVIMVPFLSYVNTAFAVMELITACFLYKLYAIAEDLWQYHYTD